MGRVEQRYISAAASRNHASAARPQDGLVAFASGHLVALWQSADERSAGVTRTLAGHGADVASLAFAQSAQASDCFVSGDAKGDVRIWTQLDRQWTTLAVLPAAHSGSVSAVEAVEILRDGGEKEYLVLTGGSDGVVKVWTVSLEGKASLAQTISLKGKIPLALALTNLPSSSSFLLAVGGTEARVQLYTSSQQNLEFRKSLSLEGHADWVRCLSFTTPIPPSADSTASTSTAYDIAPGEVLLASGSQDNYIRLWRISRRSTTVAESAPAHAAAASGLDALEEALAAVDDGELRVKAHDFTVAGDGEFSCASEAVLLGHDAWVTALNWAPSSTSSTSSLRLLSASADRSLILWNPVASGPSLSSSTAAPTPAPAPSTSSSSPSIWSSTHRFGEFTSSTNLGFFGALWGLDARTVLASGWGGSWHVWRCGGAGGGSAGAGQEDEEGDDGEWVPQVAVSGHHGSVKQVVWEGEGQYLLSASSDMSARLHAPWRRQIKNEPVETWHELGRPQIHGYPLASVAFTSPNKRLQFVSGADEKIVRVFDAPKTWVQTLRALSGVDVGDEESRPMAANVPPLGLSNRAIATEADNLAPASNDPFDAVTPVNFTVSEQPPLEEQLLGSLLWPEVEKLYGHAFELVAVASAHSAPLIATACKATAPEHAVVRLYNTDSWQPVGTVLDGHSLTITKLVFSPSSTGDKSEVDRWLLSVSRDRSWRLYERGEGEGQGEYRPCAAVKSHARIIWDAAWASDASFFATASRDKTVKVWAQEGASWTSVATLKFEDACTSVAASFDEDKRMHVLAVGLESGEIHLFTATPDSLSSWTPLAKLTSSVAHVLAVTTLAFCPRRPSSSMLRLASGSDDHSVRIFDVEL
ncbi:uncharacterized protein RHOBADRAFT_44457 [Rhodotorula graminis WP1]|uniref:Elongator complex protein 2 n=1 Tax=Rhodotorula graminis (strain WP1) TaxID=578459 RepID=A0A194S2H6_RHOGW|nr:uncharacterized protein RHOBADRAFT_44457 [Rhodotorula graminis WP1]KPV74938.1 hypothetical protein RHOBADRAFT_44457 [Rhodotorula graminis WP1]